MKSYDVLRKITTKYGVAFAACHLGMRDTGRVKNWLLRKKIPNEFELSVLSLKELLNENK